MTRTLARSTLVLLTLAALLLAACGGGNDESQPADPDTVAANDGATTDDASQPDEVVANQDSSDDASMLDGDDSQTRDDSTSPRGDDTVADIEPPADDADATTDVTTSSAMAFVETAAERTAESDAYQFAMEFGMVGVPDFPGTMAFGAEGAFDPANGRMHMLLDMNSLLDAVPAGTSEEELALMRAFLGDGIVEFIVDGDTVYVSWTLFNALFGAETKWVSMTDAGAGGDLVGSGLAGIDLDTLGSGPDALFGLVPGLTSLEEDGSAIIRGVATTHFVGEIDLAEAVAATSDPDARAELEAAYADLGVGAFGTVPFEIWVDDDGYVRKFTMTFDFADFGTEVEAGASEMWITAEFFGFGEAIDISIPSPDEVTIVDENSLFGGAFDVDSGTSDSGSGGGNDASGGTPVPVSSLVPGDCFNDSDDAFFGQADTVDAVSCNVPHDNEVYTVVTLPGGLDAPYPGDDVVYNDSVDACIDLFEDYVGIDYWESALIADPITPTETSWTELGDRESVCFLYDLFLEPLEGSMQGSMR